jgi:hypothetical protein
LNDDDDEIKKNPQSLLQIQFKRNIKSYAYTIPSYIVYILTLLMFLLPQQSNQRLIIGFYYLIPKFSNKKTVNLFVIRLYVFSYHYYIMLHDVKCSASQ